MSDGDEVRLEDDDGVDMVKNTTTFDILSIRAQFYISIPVVSRSVLGLLASKRCFNVVFAISSLE